MPWIGGGEERERDRLRHALQGATQILIDRAQILSLLLGARVPVIEDHEGDACIGEMCHVVEYGKAADGDRMVDAGDSLRDL